MDDETKLKVIRIVRDHWITPLAQQNKRIFLQNRSKRLCSLVNTRITMFSLLEKIEMVHTGAPPEFESIVETSRILSSERSACGVCRACGLHATYVRTWPHWNDEITVECMSGSCRYRKWIFHGPWEEVSNSFFYLSSFIAILHSLDV